jgi:acyl carrier protein
MTRDKLQDIFREVFEADDIILRDDMTADDIEDWDSLTHIHLIETIENVSNIIITPQEAAGLERIGDFIELTEKKKHK